MNDFSTYRGEAPRNFVKGPPAAVPRLESISSKDLNLPPTTEQMSPAEIAAMEAANLLNTKKQTMFYNFQKLKCREKI